MEQLKVEPIAEVDSSKFFLSENNVRCRFNY